MKSVELKMQAVTVQLTEVNSNHSWQTETIIFPSPFIANLCGLLGKEENKKLFGDTETFKI